MENRFLFPNSRKCILLSSFSHLEGRKKHRGRAVIATLFNSGRHLYFDQSWPRWYEAYDQPLYFLRYKEFCGDGMTINDVHVQHLGHINGVSGGEATVRIEYGNVQWTVSCNPCRLYYLIDFFDEAQALFVSDNFVVLPRTLLEQG